METLWQDIRYGVRMLVKNRGFTAVAVLALALGIGVNTAVFSVADGLLWKPLPVPESERLAMVLELRPRQTEGWVSVSPANYLDWQEQAKSFTEWAAFHYEELNLTGAGDPEQLQGARATPDFFTTMRAQPLLGRVFTPQDAAEGNYDVIVLGQGLWERRFGADRSIIGRTVAQSRRPFPQPRGGTATEVIPRRTISSRRASSPAWMSSVRERARQ